MDFNNDFDIIQPDSSTSLTIGGVGALVLPIGTTAQRPTATNGILRYNSDTSALDFVVGGGYQTIRGNASLATTGISAAGTTQATATLISSKINNVTTVASGAGVVLPAMIGGDSISIVNKGANALFVYPALGSSIGTSAVNVSTSLAVNSTLTVTATTSTQLEISASAGTIAAVTYTTNGLMISTDKSKLDNVWYDVTNYGVLTTNADTLNVTNWNALYAILPVNAIVFFPPGTYNFASELTLSRNVQIKIMGAGKSRSILNNTSITGNLFRFSIAAYYYSFEELGFASTVTKTAGAAIQSAFDNALMDIRRCGFTNQFIGIDWSGVGSGNVGVISECVFTTPAANGFQLRINGSNINTMITNCTINITGVASIGIEINQSGAVQIVGCDIIGGTNALRVNATGTVSAIYVTNTFFDQSTLGSTVKFMGTFAISRVKFNQCGITTGAAGLSALEIAGTGTGTSIPEGIDFEQCDFYNNGFTGTTNGLLLTGVRGIAVNNCRIAGFTNGVNLTPYSANGVTSFTLKGNIIGPTENFTGNGVGILINVGSVQFGNCNISNNDLSSNTVSPLTNNGTYVNMLALSWNLGLAVQTVPLITTPAAIDVTETVIHQMSLPASSLQVGTTIKFFAAGIITAKLGPTLLPKLRLGTAGTIADTQVCATPAGTMNSGTGWQLDGVITIRTISSTGTVIGQLRLLGDGLATANQTSAQTTTVAFNSTVTNILSLTLIGGGTTPSITVVQAYTEIVRQ